VYPAIHEVHLVGVTAEQVAQGSMQLGLQDWLEVRKNPLMHEIQPVAVQLLQLDAHWMQVVPDKKNPVPHDKQAPG
jgi:hypothetical protein